MGAGVWVGSSVAVAGAVSVDSGVTVSGTGVNVSVAGTSVAEGAHPLNKIIRNMNARKTDPRDFFMTVSPFDCSEKLLNLTVYSSRLSFCWWVGRFLICNICLFLHR